MAVAIHVVDGLQAAPEEVSLPGDDDENVMLLVLGGPPEGVEGVDYHVVQDGETLADIVTFYYGDASRLGDLGRINGIAVDAVVVSGQVVYLP